MLMIKLKNLIKESDGGVDVKEIHDDYKKVKELYMKLSVSPFFDQISQLEKMTEQLDDKISALPDDYKDSDEYGELITPIERVRFEIGKFASWAIPSLEYDLDEMVDNVNTRMKNVPSDFNYT